MCARQVRWLVDERLCLEEEELGDLGLLEVGLRERLELQLAHYNNCTDFAELRGMLAEAAHKLGHPEDEGDEDDATEGEEESGEDEDEDEDGEDAKDVLDIDLSVLASEVLWQAAAPSDGADLLPDLADPKGFSAVRAELARLRQLLARGVSCGLWRGAGAA